MWQLLYINKTAKINKKNRGFRTNSIRDKEFFEPGSGKENIVINFRTIMSIDAKNMRNTITTILILSKKSYFLKYNCPKEASFL